VIAVSVVGLVVVGEAEEMPEGREGGRVIYP